MPLTISQLARRFGLSRSTLLYYDSIGLLSPEAHQDFLESLGLPEDEVARIRDASRQPG